MPPPYGGHCRLDFSQRPCAKGLGTSSSTVRVVEILGGGVWLEEVVTGGHALAAEMGLQPCARSVSVSLSLSMPPTLFFLPSTSEPLLHNMPPCGHHKAGSNHGLNPQGHEQNKPLLPEADYLKYFFSKRPRGN